MPYGLLFVALLVTCVLSMAVIEDDRSTQVNPDGSLISAPSNP
jgi:hypothetical protein